MTRRLFLGLVPKDFDPKLDVAAGPWCFVGREQDHPGWEALDFVEPFDTPAKFISAELAIAALTDRLVGVWGSKLNRKHGLDRPMIFWHRYLTLWISLAIQATWARWQNMLALVSNYGDEPLEVQVSEQSREWCFDDFPDFSAHLLSDCDFQLWMDSDIARLVAGKRWTLAKIDEPLVAQKAPATEPPQQKQWLVRKWLPRLACDHLPGISLSKLAYSAYIAAMPRGNPPDMPPLSVVAPVEFPEGYLGYLDGFLHRCLPASIGGRRFRELDGEVQRLRFYPGRLYIANTKSVSDRERLISAYALANHERVVNSQHGGWEGTAATCPWNRHAYAQDHAYLTWGWQRQAGMPGRCLPFESPLLAKIKNRHRERAPQLIFVGARIVVNGMRFDCIPRPRRILKYRQDKVRFLSSLNEDVAVNARYRPYTRDVTDLQDGEYVKRHMPSVPLVVTGFQKAMLSCRLLVVDHPGTTMHTAIAANVPTVCFWDRQDWLLCDEARPYFEALTKIGVLHDDPRAAADHINSIWNDVGGWWRSDDVQKAVRLWRRQFARTGWFSMVRLLGTLNRLRTLDTREFVAQLPLVGA